MLELNLFPKTKSEIQNHQLQRKKPPLIRRTTIGQCVATIEEGVEPDDEFRRSSLATLKHHDSPPRARRESNRRQSSYSQLVNDFHPTFLPNSHSNNHVSTNQLTPHGGLYDNKEVKHKKSASFCTEPPLMVDGHLQLDDKEKKNKKSNIFSGCFGILSTVYEKSQIQKIMPLLVLIGYTFAGAYLFSYIEFDGEQSTMLRKQAYVKQETQPLYETMFELRTQFTSISKSDYALRQKWMKKVEYEVKHQVHRFALVQYQSVDKELLLSKLPDRESPTVTRIMLDNDILRPYATTKHLPSSDVEKAVLRVELMLVYIKQLQSRLAEIIVEEELGNEGNITNFNDTDKNITRRKIEAALNHFSSILGLEHENHWSFTSAMFLAITTYTTIGYGNVVPHTQAGRIAVMIYAIIGIPLMLVILQKMGRAFLKLLQRSYRQTARLIGNTCRDPSTIKTMDNNTETEEVPLTLAIGVTLAWMFVSAELFTRAEKSWDYFQSFYFVFISFATVGFGDVVPQSEYALWMFTLVFVGLSLLSMTINVIQLKLELVFEAMWQELVQQYTEGGADSIDAPPPGDMSIWQLMKVVRKRRQSVHSNVSSILPKRKRRTGRDLLTDWRRLSNMRAKATQTDNCYVQEACIQTDYLKGQIVPVDSSPLLEETASSVFFAPKLVGAHKPIFGPHPQLRPNLSPKASFLPLSLNIASETTPLYDYSETLQELSTQLKLQVPTINQIPINQSSSQVTNTFTLPQQQVYQQAAIRIQPHEDSSLNYLHDNFNKINDEMTKSLTNRHSIEWTDRDYFKNRVIKRNDRPDFSNCAYQSIDIYPGAPEEQQIVSPKRITSQLHSPESIFEEEEESISGSGGDPGASSSGLDKDRIDKESAVTPRKRWTFVKTAALGKSMKRQGPRGLAGHNVKRESSIFDPDEMRRIIQDIHKRMDRNMEHTETASEITDYPVPMYEPAEQRRHTTGPALLKSAALALTPHVIAPARKDTIVTSTDSDKGRTDHL